MSTRQLAEGYCDHGAQYITASDPDFQRQIQQWQAEGLVDIWEPRLLTFGARTDGKHPAELGPITRYVGVPKMTAPSVALAGRLKVAFSTRIVRIEPSTNGWMLFDDAGDTGTEAGYLVFAIPPEQILPILGSATPTWVGTVQATTMSPCWTVMAVTTGSDKAACDAAFVNEGPLAWIANNATKPGRSTAAIWTLHATADWSRKHVNAAPDEVATALSAAFEKITGQHVINTVTHRWLYAKADAPGANRYLWDPTQKLGAIGDWLCQGNVEGAWMSGALCADHLLNSELETT